MKKKLLSMTLAAALVVSSAAFVSADDEKTPAVFVDNGEIMFEDQGPVILGEGYTVVPARGVFEAMDAVVEWKAETQQVDVTSADGNTLIRLFIDNNSMKVYDLSGLFGTLMSGQDFKAPEKEIALDVAPQLIGGRTMIPLRAISEALNADVKWNGADYTINISTGKAPTASDNIPQYSLSADKLTAAAGETVDLYINVKNLPEDKFVSSVTAAINFDTESFEYVGAQLVNGETPVEGALLADNANFAKGLCKVSSVTISSDIAAKTDGAVLKLTFKSINGKEGEFSLSNGYHTEHGYHTTLLVDSVEAISGNTARLYEGKSLYVNTDKVVINGAGAALTTPAPTATPDATAAPTAAPDATAAPTATPDATATPTAAPDATIAPTATPAA